MQGTYLFMVWAHLSADSMFGAASSPVMRNGAFLSFESERKTLAEAEHALQRQADARADGAFGQHA
jgi:hypothetical protein